MVRHIIIVSRIVNGVFERKESTLFSRRMATQYVGKMFDGQMHGLGKLIYDNEEYYNGEFIRGEELCYWISQVTRLLISFTTQREKAWPRRVCLLRRLNFQGYELH